MDKTDKIIWIMLMITCLVLGWLCTQPNRVIPPKVIHDTIVYRVEIFYIP